jgi:hypothetical protein
MSQLSRREALQFGGSLAAASLAGCSSLPFTDQRLTLTVLNFDSAVHSLRVELLRTENHETVYQKKFQLEPPTGKDAASEIQNSKVAESRAYLVRASLDNVDNAHYHFVPSSDCKDANKPSEIVVEVHSRGDDEAPYLTFLRNGTIRCN